MCLVCGALHATQPTHTNTHGVYSHNHCTRQACGCSALPKWGPHHSCCSRSCHPSRRLQRCCCLLCHLRIFGVKEQMQQPPPHRLRIRVLHGNSGTGTQISTGCNRLQAVACCLGNRGAFTPCNTWPNLHNHPGSAVSAVLMGREGRTPHVCTPQKC